MKLTKIESYEIQAFAFRVMTGYMAPGKDVSPLACEAPYEERCAAWDEWRNKHAHCILAMLHGFEALIDRDDEPTGALLDEMEQMRELADALAHGTHFVDSPELHEAMTKAANVLRQCAERRPDGWQLVPVEPTGRMVDAGREAMQRAPDLGGIVSANTAEVMDSYRAMLAAAPAVPHHAMLASHRRLVEQAIQNAEHPSGMSTHDGKARIDASVLRRMLAIIDSLPAAPQAEPKREPLSDEQIYEIGEPFGYFQYGDAQGDKRRAFVRAIERAHGIGGSDAE